MDHGTETYPRGARGGYKVYTTKGNEAIAKHTGKVCHLCHLAIGMSEKILEKNGAAYHEKCLFKEVRMVLRDLNPPSRDWHSFKAWADMQKGEARERINSEICGITS